MRFQGAASEGRREDGGGVKKKETDGQGWMHTTGGGAQSSESEWVYVYFNT